ncbi:MAG: ATP phosphoribosyltransferase regulatory subunit [Phototrophicales bacterium]
MTRYGYQLIETPIIEKADLFLTKAGDQVAERLFTFERHGHNLALRPEFTAAAAHLYTITNNKNPVRWQFSGPIFEDNPTDPTQQYQHYSSGAELIGMAGPIADAEIISMAVQGLKELEIEDWTLVIGHVGLTRHLLASFDLDPRTQHFILSHRDMLRYGSKGKINLLALLAQYIPYMERQHPEYISQNSAEDLLEVLLNTTANASTMGGRSRDDIARRLLRKRQQGAQATQIKDALYFLQKWMNIRSTPAWAMDDIENFVGYDVDAAALYADWQTVIQLLQAYQIPLERVMIQPDLARTWDYYTGLVFEIRTEAGLQLAGGGRYDELTRLIGGVDSVPAVGFAYYVDRLLRILPKAHIEQPRTFYLLMNVSNSAIAAQWATELRKRGINIILTDQAEHTANAIISLQVDTNGNLLLGRKTYTFETIDLLVKTLNGR